MRKLSESGSTSTTFEMRLTAADAAELEAAARREDCSKAEYLRQRIYAKKGSEKSLSGQCVFSVADVADVLETTEKIVRDMIGEGTLNLSSLRSLLALYTKRVENGSQQAITTSAEASKRAVWDDRPPF